ncbi:DciA family protein [sulfur-oxidizing endosymbiont of Gigantopelta aegis]|uniref:DciA family protein n=1 Tax=sulfur-oxidizing endosymbiont of Gigantopelta aegis TaxID=2794934 RepID=UPI0018DE3F17|nr:DciA family protein [sulfur-oxidizing endosymbiont of Gigantopelta aegis]
MKKIFQQPSASIERLMQHSRYLDYLSKRLLTYLPDEFSNKLSVLGFTKKNHQVCLVVGAISAAWASKLRFYTPTLKRALTADAQFSQLQKIIIKVASAKTDTKKATNLPKYSQNAATIIQGSAQHISDNDLKASLMRLAQHVSKTNQ